MKYRRNNKSQKIQYIHFNFVEAFWKQGFQLYQHDNDYGNLVSERHLEIKMYLLDFLNCYIYDRFSNEKSH